MHTRWLLLPLILPVLANAAIELQAPVPVAPTCVREGKRIQRQPAVAFGKSVYLVAWCDGFAPARQAHGRHLLRPH